LPCTIWPIVRWVSVTARKSRCSRFARSASEVSLPIAVRLLGLICPTRSSGSDSRRAKLCFLCPIGPQCGGFPRLPSRSSGERFRKQPNRAALLFVFAVVPICSYYGASQDCHTRELYEVQGITSTRTPRALSRGETNEASSWSCTAQLPI